MSELKAVMVLGLLVCTLVASTILGTLLGLLIAGAVTFWLATQYYEYRAQLKAKEPNPDSRADDSA